MKNIVKEIGKYTLLFGSLYIMSIIVLKIFTMMNIQYDNISNTTFYATLFSMIVIVVTNNLIKRNVNIRKQRKRLNIARIE